MGITGQVNLWDTYPSISRFQNSFIYYLYIQVSWNNLRLEIYSLFLMGLIVYGICV